jgi:hypothetical protein
MLCWSLLIVSASAQTPTVIGTGLKAPIKLTLSDSGNLLVTEAGDGINAGRISRVSRCGGTLPLISGLPSAPAPNREISGPSGIEVRDRTVYVAIGTGNGVIVGPTPGTEAPNPAPSSPIFTSILQIDFGVDIDELSSGFTLTQANQTTLKSGGTVTLTNAQGVTATVRLLIDYPDFTTNPTTRASNPFALALQGNQLFLADASQNTITRIDITTGASTLVTTIPQIENPLTPMGPPRIDPVPTGIRFVNGRLLVTTLTGFPFPAGRSIVLSIDPVTGQTETVLTGLTNGIDLIQAQRRDGSTEILTLEYSTNFLSNAPGRIQSFASFSSAPTVVATTIATPTGFARDPLSGDIFVASRASGQISLIAGNNAFTQCLEDDESGDVLRLNPITGEYLFVSCRLGTQFSGVARVVRSGCRVTLISARITASIEGCTGFSLLRGRASVKLTNVGPTVVLEDSNLSNNRCAGR